MKPLPRFFRFHFSVAFFWAQIVVGVFAAEKPASPVGVEELKGRTTANVETRTVLIDNIEITAVRFPALSNDEGIEMEALLKSTFPGKPLTVSLDRLITSVQAGVVVAAEDVFATKRSLLLS
jgi:hypothetical protein